MKRTLTVALLAMVLLALRAYGRPSTPSVVPAPRLAPATSAEARGRLVFERYGCRMCHGDDGKGGFSNPNSETDGKVPGVIYVKEGYTAAELAQLIRQGTASIGREDSTGQIPPYRMPGWGDRMGAGEVDDLVQYLLSLYPKAAEENWR